VPVVPVGFYGKLPSHGDFLHRGVSDDFVNHWDAWLQDGMSRSRSELGATWLDVFLTSPIWRFALASRVVGGAVWAGILLPSVDRVGRYFPLTIVAELPPGVLPFEVSVAGNGWFDWAEALARRTLDDELVDLDRLEVELRESEALLGALRVPGERLELEALCADDAPAWWLALAQDGDMGRFFARFADGLAASAREPLALWWSIGSERVAPSVLMTRGLPPATAFRELLGGPHTTAASLADTIVAVPLTLPPMTAHGPSEETITPWPLTSPPTAEPRQSADTIVPPPLTLPPTAERWQSADTIVPVPLTLPPTAEPRQSADTIVPEPLALPPTTPHWPSADTIVPLSFTLPPTAVHWRSAAISDLGRVRDENQDAFVERAGDGLWLVADGMGGHEGGKMASQLLAERVNRLAVTGNVAAVARDVVAAISAANAELRSHGAAQPGFDGGSTVVALCLRGDEGIALWAGDSRLYRLRRGELVQLTRDHSVAEEAGSAASEAHMLTRAVGGADVLALEELRLDIWPGDRLLLCSDGLYGDLTPEEIAARLAIQDCEAATKDLVALALERGGGDNATAVVIAVNDDAAVRRFTGQI
jgi:type VI secretion system ImpM family protein